MVDGCNLIDFAGTTASFARFVPQKTRDGQKPIWWMEEMMKYIFSSVSKSKVLVSQYLQWDGGDVKVFNVFGSFSTICQPHVQTLGQQHLRGVKAVTELQFYAHRVAALILTKSYDCLVLYCNFL